MANEMAMADLRDLWAQDVVEWCKATRESRMPRNIGPFTDELRAAASAGARLFGGSVEDLFRFDCDRVWQKFMRREMNRRVLETWGAPEVWEELDEYDGILLREYTLTNARGGAEHYLDCPECDRNGCSACHYSGSVPETLIDDCPAKDRAYHEHPEKACPFCKDHGYVLARAVPSIESELADRHSDHFDTWAGAWRPEPEVDL